MSKTKYKKQNKKTIILINETKVGVGAYLSRGEKRRAI